MRALKPKLSPMIELRPTQIADLDFVRDTERHPDNAPFILQWTRSQHTEALNHPDIDHQIIVRVSDRAPVGYVILCGLEDLHCSLELKRLVIAEKGQGYGKQALHLIQTQAFEQYEAHRLWLDVKDFNARAYHLYQRVGFVEEGRLRECFQTEQGFETLILMSMLEAEYLRQSAPPESRQIR